MECCALKLSTLNTYGIPIVSLSSSFRTETKWEKIEQATDPTHCTIHASQTS